VFDYPEGVDRFPVGLRACFDLLGYVFLVHGKR
jgi:hypothetical protein